MNTNQIGTELAHAIEIHLSFLRDMSFEFSGVTVDVTSALGTCVRCSFANKKVNRAVCVAYIPKQDGPREIAITSIRLIESEPSDDFDYTTTDSMQVCATDLSAVDGDFGTRIEHHLSNSARRLKAHFVGVLKGRAWQSDSIDWGGMK